MTSDDLSRANWRKSSFSGNTGNCVEVAITETVVGVRDSKDPEGVILRVGWEEWRGLLAHITAGI